MTDELHENYRHHPPPNARVGVNHDAMRGACLRLAYSIQRRVPDGREREQALLRLEEVMFWANAGIARSGYAGPEGPECS